jgi:tRNA A-37 threonylcarbamoyl transferase component Bud32
MAKDDELTRLAGDDGFAADETRMASPSAAVRPPSSQGSQSAGTSGWLSSSGAIDHGRFAPGTVLGNRYRIVGRLGRGGMGEVFRADDLKLGQQVALKFLPAEVDQDPARLTQLHTEVRMARQVSHPNVCRVYDIDEIDGHTFLSMEFVDGEDLASLIRRVGRFPEERGLELARQICAGLAAAHERGVVHRDFKPANVMLDGTGRVRITDFGLAGVSGEAIRAGTPAYMAPEQLAGSEVTARSDIYALGLVLYELFTGKRALEGRNLAELIHKREQSGIIPPTALVRDLHHDIEAGIMRCLRPEPEERPASALAVAAALPGGDPLAAALAAGETPSPEMVAAAGLHEAISLRTALAGAAWIVVSLAAIVLMYERVMMINVTPPAKSPAALQDRAEEALHKLGYGDAIVGRASGLGVSMDFARYIEATSQEPDRWNALRSGRPETFYAWYRTSPRPLVPFGSEHPTTGTNPPLSIAGMTLLVVDGSGRLSEFHAVPQPIQSDNARRVMDWGTLFAAAGLDMAAFKEVDPQWLPVSYADERRAWEGTVPELPSQPVRLEASAFNGRAVSFVMTGPWSRSARASQPIPPSVFTRILEIVAGIVMPALMLAAAALAAVNIWAGRGDRRGATRAALFLLILQMAAWVITFRSTGMFGEDFTRLTGAIGRALFGSGLLWLTYLGLEPYIRRFSPDSLIGWTRILSGRWRDPQVGFDVLLGVCAGLAMTLLYAAHNLIPPLLGGAEPMPLTPADPNVLLGSRFVAGWMLQQVGSAISSGMLAVVGVVTLLIVAKRKWAAHLLSSAIFVWVVIQGMFPPGTPVLDVSIGLGIILIWTAVILWGGLLSTVAALAVHFVLLRAPITLAFSSWRGGPGITYLLLVGGVGLLAAYLAWRPALSTRRPA